jgi:hypothetical protein
VTFTTFSLVSGLPEVSAAIRAGSSGGLGAAAVVAEVQSAGSPRSRPAEEEVRRDEPIQPGWVPSAP